MPCVFDVLLRVVQKSFQSIMLIFEGFHSRDWACLIHFAHSIFILWSFLILFVVNRDILWKLMWGNTLLTFRSFKLIYFSFVGSFFILLDHQLIYEILILFGQKLTHIRRFRSNSRFIFIWTNSSLIERCFYSRLLDFWMFFLT